jgi:hypothetical protein
MISIAPLEFISTHLSMKPSMAPHHSSKEEPDPENSFNNFDNASTAGIMTAPQGQVRNRSEIIHIKS